MSCVNYVIFYPNYIIIKLLKNIIPFIAKRFGYVRLIYIFVINISTSNMKIAVSLIVSNTCPHQGEPQKLLVPTNEVFLFWGQINL